MDLVSVCITTYNRKALLETCMSSILNQTYSNLEIIIIDDCSKDGTEDFVISTKKKDDRIIYIKNKINVGLAAARNKAIFIAKGKYFTFLDDDDEWLPSFVEDFVQIAEDYGSNYVYCCGCLSVDQLGIQTISIPNSSDGDLFEYVKNGYTPPVAGQFYFTSTLRSVNGYNVKVKSGVDHDLWIKLAKSRVKIKFLDKCLAKVNVRIDPQRITQSKKRLERLEESQELWKNDLIQMYGIRFFDRFCEAYRAYEEDKIIRNNILSMSFSAAISLFVKSRKRSFKNLIKSFVFLLLIKMGLSFNRNRTVVIGPTLKI